MDSIYLYLFLYIALIIGIALWVSRREGKEDFLISGRDRKGWQILFSKFSAAVGVSWFVTYTAWSYEFGWGVYTLLLGFMIGYPLFGYWAVPRIYELSRKRRYYTMGDYVVAMTGSELAKRITNVIVILYFSGWLLVGIVGGAKLVELYGFLSYELALILTAGVVLSYILIAGFKAVIITDIFQGIIILVLLAIVALIIIQQVPIGTVLSEEVGRIDIAAVIGMFLWGLTSVFASADRYQLTYAGKDRKAVSRGISLAILPVLIVSFFLLLVGLFMHMNDAGLDPDIVFIQALVSYLPASFIPIAIVLFFAGLMSSVDTAIYGIASHHALMKRPKNPVRSIRIASIVVIVVMVFIGLIMRDVVDISILTGAVNMTLVCPMLYLLFGGKRVEKFFASIIAGTIGVILYIAIVGLDPAGAMAVLIGGGIGLLWRGRSCTN